MQIDVFNTVRGVYNNLTTFYELFDYLEHLVYRWELKKVISNEKLLSILPLVIIYGN